MQMTTTPLLDMIENMDELRRLPEGELQRLAAELRDATIGAVSKTGGHLGVGLDATGIAAALRTMPGLDAAGAAPSPQKKTSS